MKRLRQTLAVLGATLCLSACAEYDYLLIDVVSDPPTNYEIDSTRIELYVGTSVVVFVDPVSSVRTDFADNGRVVDLYSESSTVLEVHAVEGEDRWIFAGNNPGTTCLEVHVKGRMEECIPVVVREPEAGYRVPGWDPGGQLSADLEPDSGTESN